MLKRTGRYLVLYAVILVALGWLFVHLPTSFLPEEDQGYFINMIQLPPGATRERTLEVLSQVEQFYLKQPEVEHVIGVLGFSFFGRGQNAAIAFVRLKDWDERPGPDSSAPALVKQRQHGAVPHQAGDDLCHQRAADSRTGGGRRFRLPPAGPFRPGAGKAAGGAQHGAGHGRQESRAGRRAAGRPGSRRRNCCSMSTA